MFNEYTIELYWNVNTRSYDFIEISKKPNMRAINSEYIRHLAFSGYKPFTGWSEQTKEQNPIITYHGENVVTILMDLSRMHKYIIIRTIAESESEQMHYPTTKNRPVTTTEVKRANKAKSHNSRHDTNSASGIQPWSRFTPESTEDYEELGFIHGSNALPFKFPTTDRASMAAYNRGYVRGEQNHKPFDENGNVRPTA